MSLVFLRYFPKHPVLWIGRIARMGDMKHSYKISVGKLEEVLKKQVVDWIHLGQGEVQ